MPTEVEQKAIDNLVDFSGCTKERAQQLIAAMRKAAAKEALGVVAGTERVSTTITDQRVERVKGLVDALGTADLPNQYELSALLRVPPTQARAVLRNWRARYPDHYEVSMKKLAAKGENETGGNEKHPTYVVSYKNSDVLEYAVDCLRRKGLQQGLKVDRSALTIEIPEATTDAKGKGALAVLDIT